MWGSGVKRYEQRSTVAHACAWRQYRVQRGTVRPRGTPAGGWHQCTVHDARCTTVSVDNSPPDSDSDSDACESGGMQMRGCPVPTVADTGALPQNSITRATVWDRRRGDRGAAPGLLSFATFEPLGGSAATVAACMLQQRAKPSHNFSAVWGLVLGANQGDPNISSVALAHVDHVHDGGVLVDRLVVCTAWNSTRPTCFATRTTTTNCSPRTETQER